MENQGETPKSSRKKVITLAAIFAVILLVLVIEWLAGAFSDTTYSGGPTQQYYTSDDGATYFADMADKPIPFVKDGKTVVRAHLFQCGGVKKVGYLSRFTPARLKALETYAASANSQSARINPGAVAIDMAAMGPGGSELKSPGGAKWINRTDRAAVEIMQFKCPDGSTPKEELFP